MHKKIIESTNIKEDEDLYVVQANLEIYHDNKNIEIESPRQVPVTFRLEFEHRSWGVKSLIASFPKPIQIDYTEKPFEPEDAQEVEKSLEVDLSDAPIDWVEGGAITVQSITIYLDNEGKIKSKEVTMAYLKP